MTATLSSHRLERERDFHDRQAAERANDFARTGADPRVDVDFYLDHASWIRPALAKLGDIHGKRLLDVGCGHGMAAVVLAQRGAVVDAVDLSPGYVAEAKIHAAASAVSVQCRVANAEALPFADGTFDGVWGNAIYHHLDREAAAREWWRVLKPGGVLVLCEPWGAGRLVKLARRLASSHRHTDDEAALTHADLAPLSRCFGTLQYQGYDLIAGLERFFPSGRRFFRRLDTAFARLVPGVYSRGRYLVVEARKR